MLPKVATGEYLGAFALSEAEAGSDVANIRCKATRADDGGWVINGTKMWCTFADQADYIILFARTSTDEDKRHRGISAFLVEKNRGEFPEGMSGTAVKKIGYFGWKTWDLNFDDFHLPADALLGEEDRGFYQAVSGLEVGRAHTAARSIGLAQAALEDSIAYLEAAGPVRTPLGGLPASAVQGCRHGRPDRSQPGFDVSRVHADRFRSHAATRKPRWSSTWLPRWRRRSPRRRVQIHGGAGYTKDFAVERHWRDARLTKIFEGSSEIQMRIISDELLGR